MAHVQGVGEVTDAQALGYYRRSGYKVTGDKPAEPDTAPQPQPPQVEPAGSPEPEAKSRKRTRKTD